MEGNSSFHFSHQHSRNSFSWKMLLIRLWLVVHLQVSLICFQGESLPRNRLRDERPENRSSIFVWRDIVVSLTNAQRPAVQQPVCELSSTTTSHTES
jgi:hypothetical protein